MKTCWFFSSFYCFKSDETLTSVYTVVQKSVGNIYPAESLVFMEQT